MSTAEDHSAGGSTVPAAPPKWPETGPRPHRFAGIFRMLAGEERESFAADIVERGLVNRIRMFEDAVLDGRNRYLVLVEEGIFEPEDEDWRERPELFEEFLGTAEAALDFVWSLNAERRHDSASQRALSAERYANLRNVTQAEAAAKFGVSERQVNSAAKVLEDGTPELVDAVEEGRLPVYLAEQVADLDDDAQREVARADKPAAAARQKLADPPPLAESGDVVKPMDASMLVMFAASVLQVGTMGHPLSLATLDGLAKAHGLLADADGTFNLSRPVQLAIGLARRKLNLREGEWAGPSAMIIGAAGLPDDKDGLAQAYRNAIVLYDRAIRNDDEAGEADYAVAMEAVLHKARLVDPVDGARDVEAAARAPDGAVPMWGQQGCFIAEGEWRDHKIKAIVSLGRFNAVYAMTPGAEFPSETGFLSISWGRFSDRDVALYGRHLIEAAIRMHVNNPQQYPMVVPQTVYRLDEGAITGPVPVDISGMELDRSAYVAALANLQEPKGKLHQSTAEAALRAGKAARVPYSQMAEDLGHPVGTVLTWLKRLDLTGKGEGRSAPRGRREAAE